MPTQRSQTGVATVEQLRDELTHLGLDGAHFSEVFETFCSGLGALGIPLLRAHVTLRARHPEFGGFANRWWRDDGTESLSFEHSDNPSDDWMRSPLHYLLSQDIDKLHQRLDAPEPALDFPFFDELRALGATDYIAFKTFFSKRTGNLAVDPNDPPEGCILSLATDVASGFDTAALSKLKILLPVLCLAFKAESNRMTARDIATTYLGRDAGTRVLNGDIVRGSVQRLHAVICYFDLSGFTRLSERLSGIDVVDMLNDYFDTAVAVVQHHGGNVLKFMGDGMLAIFDVAKTEDANRAALSATQELRRRLHEISARRESADLTATGFTLALHRGEVLYGNIGGMSRLDFTVIGPAVNTTARLSGMCAHVDQNIVISADVARPLLDDFSDLVSLGWYRLRGVTDRQELYTLDEPPETVRQAIAVPE